MSTSEKSKRTRRVLVPVEGRNPEMPAELWDALVALVKKHGRNSIVDWMVRHLTDIPTATPKSLARERLDNFLDPTHPHNTTVLARLRYVVQWFPKENPPRSAAPVAAQPMQIPVNDPDSGVFEAQSIIETPKATEPSAIEFNGRSVRMVVHGDAAMFISKDLVEAVGAEWKGTSGSLGHIPQEYRGVCLVQTPSGAQEMACLNEAGMNMYLFRSDKPAALPWQRHLAEVVLPQIRKTGTYTAPGVAPQLAPASSMDPALAAVLAQLAQGQNTLISLFSSRRSSRAMPPTNLAQQTIPQTESAPAAPEEAKAESKPPRVRRDPFGSQRLASIPAPSNVRDAEIMQVLRNMIDVYQSVTQCFDEGYNLVYDAICRDLDFGADFKKVVHGKRMTWIGSHNKSDQRRILELAYGVLVLPFLQASK